MTMKEFKFESRLEKARERVSSFGRFEKGTGRALRAIQAALIAGLRHPETGAAFDALVMLDELVVRGVGDGE